MPTVHGIPGPYRFFFYSLESGEPRHVHVERGDAVCKFWLEPVALARNNGFAAHELSRISHVIAANLPLLVEAWDEHFG